MFLTAKTFPQRPFDDYDVNPWTVHTVLKKTHICQLKGICDIYDAI